MAANEELKQAMIELQMAAQEAYQSLEENRLPRLMWHLGRLHGMAQRIADRVEGLMITSKG